MQMMYNLHLQSKSLWHYSTADYLFHSLHLSLLLLQAGCLYHFSVRRTETLTENMGKSAFCILLCIFLSTVKMFDKARARDGDKFRRKIKLSFTMTLTHKVMLDVEDKESI